MARVLVNLGAPFAVAAGSNRALVEDQFLKPLWESGFRRDFDAFFSNGSSHQRCHFSRAYEIELINESDFESELGSESFAYLIATLKNSLQTEGLRLPIEQKIVGNQITNRGSMINFSPPGREVGRISEEGRASRAQFVEFDRAVGYRDRLRQHLNHELKELMANKGLQVLIGGQTSFDIVIHGMDKTNAIRVMLQQGADRVVFFGDALFNGGNDSPVWNYVEAWSGPGECPVEAIPVEDWRHTIDILVARGWVRTAQDDISTRGFRSED